MKETILDNIERNDVKIDKQLSNVKDHGWNRLDLRNCGLKEIPREVFTFTDLVILDLGNDHYCEESKKNKIKTVPKEIGLLLKLRRINLSNNQLIEVDINLSKLTQLTYLDLTNNRLTEISPKIANLSSLKELCLEDNPFDMLPPEIVARGIESIRNFYQELDEKDFIYEVKLILVGQGRVGKTSISNALINDNYQLEDTESTEGINIDRWVIPKDIIGTINPKIKRDFQINVWDFGGQEIYHSTHQFFLTKRSIYLLVTESRKEDSHDDFYYWLNIIKLLGDKSPVIIALNKCDQPTKEIPINEYKENFSNIQGFHKISLKEGFKNQFNDFKLALKNIASNLPHIGNPLPKVWVDIRFELEELKISGINYISQDQYLEICRRHYRKEDSALFLSEYFHDLGVLLHFKDDLDLKDTVILNHSWLTIGVYKILDDRKVIEQKGRFTKDDITRIWSDDIYKYKTRELLSLMKNKKFDLCFELPDGDFMIPRLLPVDEVNHKWTSTPENTKFEFRYKFMPKGILTRLIVKMNSDIYNNNYWRYGVLLEYEGTRAFIKERYFENKITIELAGPNKREFLYSIRKTIKEIHNDYNKISVREMLPCNCDHCRSVTNPQFYDFDLLQRYEKNDILETRCNQSLKLVNVASLTNDIVRGQFTSDKIIACENKNADLLNEIGLDNIMFYAENDSASVYISAKTKINQYGLRDRDFLLDSEIIKIRSKHPNYFILDYYCFENYLYHPDNLAELNLSGFDYAVYKQEIIDQKNKKKNKIISIFRNSRKSYQEFKVQSDKLQDKKNEDEIMEQLESNDLEIFLKSYSTKDHFEKSVINKYGLGQNELSKTKWFKMKIQNLLIFNDN